MSDNSASVALLALDWGTSTLRAFLLRADGVVLAERRRPWGISSLPEGGFPAAFAAITGNWPVADLPAIASGMVGSRAGWKQVAYRTLPCAARDLADGLDRLDCVLPDGLRVALHLVPGLLDPRGPDVMRGEETEAIGALDALDRPDGAFVLVMPGTHSKWLRVEGGVLHGFATYMTGELFALLDRHSILAAATGGTPPDDATADAVFADAVRDAARDGLAGTLFRTRARMLTGGLDAALTPAHLSGLLIGEELSHALRSLPSNGSQDASPERIVLVGDPVLTARYGRAFAALGSPVPPILQAAAVRGLYRIAVAAGLVGAASGAAPC